MEDFAEVAGRYWDELYRLAYLLVGTGHDADDVMQTAMLRAWSARDRVSRAATPKAYLRRIVVTTAMDVHQDVARRRRTVGAVGIETALLQAPWWEQVDAERMDMWRLVQGLPARQRAVVVLRYYEDLSEADIAAVLGCRPGTVKSQASAALRNLRRHLEPAANQHTAAEGVDHAH